MVWNRALHSNLEIISQVITYGAFLWGLEGRDHLCHVLRAWKRTMCRSQFFPNCTHEIVIGLTCGCHWARCLFSCFTAPCRPLVTAPTTCRAGWLVPPSPHTHPCSGKAGNVVSHTLHCLGHRRPPRPLVVLTLSIYNSYFPGMYTAARITKRNINWLGG